MDHNRVLVCGRQFHFLAGINISFIRQGIVSTLAGADADDFIDRVDEDQSVSNVSGLSSLPDGFNRLLNIVVAENDVKLYARQKIHSIGTCAAGQYDPALAAMAAYFADVHA